MGDSQPPQSSLPLQGSFRRGNANQLLFTSEELHLKISIRLPTVPAGVRKLQPLKQYLVNCLFQSRVRLPGGLLLESTSKNSRVNWKNCSRSCGRVCAIGEESSEHRPSRMALKCIMCKMIEFISLFCLNDRKIQIHASHLIDAV